MHRVYVFIFQVVYRVVATDTTWYDSGGQDVAYCETEIFQARCAEDEIIVIQRAQYGRMSPGRCIQRDYGYMGCATDVIDLADSWCSGRRSCNIPVPNSAFKRRVKCPNDLKPYFEVAYNCLQVEMAPDQVCSGSSFIVPDSRSGYLSSLTALDTGLGSPECPWIIRTDPGRRVVIDLIDFGHGQSERTDFLSNGYDLCSVYAIVREPNTPNELTVCAGIERNKTVYTSVSHTLEISILGERGSFSEIGYFILKYEVFGCADPVAPDNTWLKRREDTAFIGCQASGETWQLRCTGSDWAGHVGNCTRELSVAFADIEILLLTIAAVALFVGFLLACFGLCCMNRKRAKRKENGAIVQESAVKSTETGNLPPPPAFIMDHQYEYISDMPPPPPPSPSPPPLGKPPPYVHFADDAPTVCPSGKIYDRNDNTPLSPADTNHNERLHSQDYCRSYDLVATGEYSSSSDVTSALREVPYRASGPRTATISIRHPRGGALAKPIRNGYGSLSRQSGQCSSPKYGCTPTYFKVESDSTAGMYSVRHGRCIQPPPEEPTAHAQETLPVNVTSKTVTL